MPVGDLIRANAANPQVAERVFLQFEETRFTFAQYYRECCRWARLLLQIRERGSLAPFHVGVLLDNTPDYLFALGGAALAGAVVVGINNTKRGAHLAQDIAHTDCGILITEPAALELLLPVLDQTGVERERLLVTDRWQGAHSPRPLAGTSLAQALDGLAVTSDPQLTVRDPDPFVLVFTSGTVSAPKAVICSHGRMVETGKNIAANVYGLSGTDVGYIAMPLFHANALMCGWMPALSAAAAVALTRKFSKSHWLSDVRRHRATYFNYTGKPLAYILTTPPQPDDRDNPMRICFGNEGSARVVAEFETRFDCRVIDVFGASEGGLGVTRQPGDPPASIGMPAPGIVVVDSEGMERPPARFDDAGRLLNPEEAIGEVVNTLGTAWFEGYYKNPGATAERTRRGWYWSGDLGYRDQRGYLYFAGRDVDWLRVDGENFLGRPVEEILLRFPGVLLAALYGVADPDGGDRVMAALVLRAGHGFDADAFAQFLAAQPDLSPKWMPTYVRIALELPQTASVKVLKNELRRQKYRPDLCLDPIFWRPERRGSFRPFTAVDFDQLRARFAAAGREQALEI